MNAEKVSSSYPSDLLPERGVERRGGRDDLGEAGGPGEGAAELGPGPDVGDPVERLGPPLVPLDAQPRHGGRIVDEQPDLLLQRQPPEEVLHPHMDRQARPAEPQAPGQPVPWVACERGASPRSGSEEEEEEEREPGFGSGGGGTWE